MAGKRRSPSNLGPLGRKKDVPGYNSWRGMRDRCLNPRATNYSWYGGKGVTVCERWRTSFEAFIEDIGPRPSPRHSIERLDGTKGYEPGNCVWALPSQQSRNLSSNVAVEINGRRKLLADVAADMGLKRTTVLQRYRKGANLKDALAPPQHPDLRYTFMVEYQGELLHLAEAARRAGMLPNTLALRIKGGLPRSEWFLPPKPRNRNAPGTYPKGVRPLGRRYQARVTLDGKTKCLGCFDTPEEAAAACALAAGIGVPE